MDLTTTTDKPYTLWHRPPGKGQRWRSVGTAATTSEALDMMKGSGDWMTLPTGRHPNDRPPPRN
jgi:hypothetical protein